MLIISERIFNHISGDSVCLKFDLVYERNVFDYLIQTHFNFNWECSFFPLLYTLLNE